MTTFNDIFKSSFLEKASTFSITDVLLSLFVSLAIGLFIFIVYKKTFSGIMYSASFAISLIAMALITTLIILAVTSNVILSLGMVGALSIVRFRSAVKEPLDIAFLFWAISVGIVTGAGFIPLAVIGSVIIGVVLVLFANKKPGYTPYIVVIGCDSEEAENAAYEIIKRSTNKSLIKSKSISANGIELTVEVRLKETSTVMLNQILAINGVNNAVLVSYNGDYMA